MSDQIKNRIDQASFVTVEVGPGPKPSYPLFSGLPNELYVGWNIEETHHDYLQAEIEAMGVVNALAVHADIRQGESVVDRIGGCTVDRVVMCNVMGEPDSKSIYCTNRDFNRDGGSYLGSSEIGFKQEAVMQSFELLKPGGEVVIAEVYTPPCSHKKMARMLRRNDFRSVVSITDRNEEYWSLLPRLGQEDSDNEAQYPPYIVTGFK